MHWSWTASQSRPTFSWVSVTWNWRTMMRPSAICKKVRRKDGESLQNLTCVFLVVYSLLIMLFPFLVANDVSALVPALSLLISACFAGTTVSSLSPIAKSIYLLCVLVQEPRVKPVLLCCCFCLQLIIWQKSRG